MSSKKRDYNTTDSDNSPDAINTTDSTWDSDPSGTGADQKEADAKKKKKKEVEAMEQDVDRLIDADSNEYVLSRSRGGFLLTLDPLLIQARPAAGPCCCVTSCCAQQEPCASHLIGGLNASCTLHCHKNWMRLSAFAAWALSRKRVATGSHSDDDRQRGVWQRL